MNIRRRVSIVALSGLAFLLSGCQITGGGKIASVSGVSGELATFALNGGDSCGNNENSKVKGRVNYHDQHAPGFDGGVKLNAEVTSFEASFGVYRFEVTYRSTNPNYPGEGTAIVEAYEAQTDPEDVDSFSISIEDGPYVGYSNAGTPTNGTLQAHRLCRSESP